MDWRYNTLWNEQLPDGEFEQCIFQQNTKLWQVESGASYIILEDYKPKSRSFIELNGATDAISAEFNRANVRSFEGSQTLGQIKRLELHHCIKLESDKGLAAISESLEWLHINTSRKFEPCDELYKLTNLKVLCLNSCAPLENLNFLSHYPNLLDFRFVNTNVLDGNLEPLLEHPSLVNVGYLNKRHYNISEKQSDEHFENKKEEAVTYTHKGEDRTFRYTSLLP